MGDSLGNSEMLSYNEVIYTQSAQRPLRAGSLYPPLAIFQTDACFVHLKNLLFHVNQFVVHMNQVFVHVKNIFIHVNQALVQMNQVLVQVKKVFIHMNQLLVQMKNHFIHVDEAITQIRADAADVIVQSSKLEEAAKRLAA
jgi:hypothetical protein